LTHSFITLFSLEKTSNLKQIKMTIMSNNKDVIDFPARAAPNAQGIKPAKKRMSISLSGQIAETLEHLAESQEITQNEALIKAIALAKYFMDQREQGSKILIQKADGKELTEVVFL
jgi:hypothetical protein